MAATERRLSILPAAENPNHNRKLCNEPRLPTLVDLFTTRSQFVHNSSTRLASAGSAWLVRATLNIFPKIATVARPVQLKLLLLGPDANNSVRLV